MAGDEETGRSCGGVVEQRGAKLLVSSLTHPYDLATFLVNEVVDPEPDPGTPHLPGNGKHFSTRSCRAFREHVLRIWGPGGCRSPEPRVMKCRRCGEVGNCECPPDVGRKSVPEDRYDEAVGFDGRLLLGPRPHARWEPDP